MEPEGYRGKEPIVKEYIRWFGEINQPPLWATMTWRGIPILKAPSDIWTYQELIHTIRPQRIVEFGTRFGGSALFFADMLEIMQIEDGKILSVDISELQDQYQNYFTSEPGIGIVEHRPTTQEEQIKRPSHPRLSYLVSDSLAEEAVDFVYKFCEGASSVWIIEDSLHEYAHVKKELELYSSLVTPGSYFVVEDMYIAGMYEAIAEFLESHSEFSIDKNAERFGHTAAIGGFLRRTK